MQGRGGLKECDSAFCHTFFVASVVVVVVVAGWSVQRCHGVSTAR